MQKLNRRSIVIESIEPRMLFDASLLTDTIAQSTFASSISDQSIVRGKVTVDVTNNTTTVQKGAFDVNIVLTPDSSLDPQSNDVSKVGVVGGGGSLAVGASKHFTVPVTLKPGELSDNLYTIYAIVADEAGLSQSAAGPTLTVRPPIVSLAETETIAKLPTTITPGGKLTNVTDKIAITNSGTDPLSTPFGISVYATPDGTLASGTLLTTIPTTSKAKINPGKTLTLPVKLTAFPNLADGTYTLITAITQANGVVTSTSPTAAPSIIVGAAPSGGGTTVDSNISSSIYLIKPTYAVDPTDPTQRHLTDLETGISFENAGPTVSGTLSLYTSTSPTFDSTATKIDSLPTNVTLNQDKIRKTLIIFGIHVVPADYGSDINDYIFVEFTTTSGKTSVAKYSKTVEFYGAAT
jgi:hypothetical protein